MGSAEENGVASKNIFVRPSQLVTTAAAANPAMTAISNEGVWSTSRVGLKNLAHAR